MRRKRNERGATVVEFAVVLPVLLLILFSMIDFGRYFYVRISLSSATFEVADAITRGLLVTTDTASEKEAKLRSVINDISPGIASFAQIDSSAQLIMAPLPEACPNSNNKTHVVLTTSFNSISPIKSFFNTAKSSSSMRCLR